MTYQNAKRLSSLAATALAALVFAIVPQIIPAGFGPWPVIVFSAAAFVLVFLGRTSVLERLDLAQRRNHAARTENRIVYDFAARVGAAFTTADLVEAVKDCLEKPADMSVLFLRSNTWETIYRSPTATLADPAVLALLENNFRDWTEGFTFLNEELSLAVSSRGARGFFIHSKGFHFFVLTRLCTLIEDEAFRALYGEIRIFFERAITISDLFEIASLSKEWELVAETQRSFLPKALPTVRKLDLAISYRPLINVSGDFYDTIAVDEDRTLLVTGDVSGKGLAAGLIMGIIVNTIRVAPDKADLKAIVKSVDEAVREMGFDDKYTVLFLGLIDTANKSLRYVNAAMADPLVVAQTALGPKIRRLVPTMGLIGLVPIDEEIVVEELPLHTDELILLASDGVTEVSNETGLRLGDSADFERAILQASKFGAEDFVASLQGLLYAFVGNAPLKDDVTILAAKVGRLWD